MIRFPARRALVAAALSFACLAAPAARAAGPLYLRASFNDWGTGAPMVQDGETWRVSLDLDAGAHDFKLADATWSNDRTYSGAADRKTTVTLGTPLAVLPAPGIGNDLHLALAEGGTYVFELRIAAADPAHATLLVRAAAAGEGEGAGSWEGPAEQHLAAPLAAPRALHATGDVLPPPEAFFRATGIVVPAPEVVGFVYGDNVDGYYDGRTHTYAGDPAGTPAYLHPHGALFTSFASFVDGRFADRTVGAVRTVIEPAGVRTEYASGAWDRLLVHPGRRALSLTVHAAAPARLALVPRFALRRATTHVRRVGDVLLVAIDSTARVAGQPAFVAIVPDRPCRAHEADLAAHRELVSTVKLRASLVRPWLETETPQREFTLTLVFDATGAGALAQARELAGRDVPGEVRQAVYDRLARGAIWTGDSTYDRALVWARCAAWSLVTHQYGPGIWAGLPWFRDNWGRDTFISLPGTLLDGGALAEARAVLDQFAALQDRRPDSPDRGRIPNRVAGPGDVAYNTVDGTPWWVRETVEYVRWSGDAAYARVSLPRVAAYLDAALAGHVDADGLLRHADADTWMDAQFGSGAGKRAWTARGDRAVEVEALWCTALEGGEELARLAGDAGRAAAYAAAAQRARTAFVARFWDASRGALADHLRADGSADVRVRPNQLLALTVPLGEPLLAGVLGARVVHTAVSTLLVPYGVLSLDPDDASFHPYHDRRPEYHKDAAYHNGTIWEWNAGFTVGALARCGRADLAYDLTRSLAAQMTTLPTRGTLPELLDALPGPDGAPHASGTFSQAWSVAEFARNATEDYVGWRPNLPAGEVLLAPTLPAAWPGVDAALPLGERGTLRVGCRRSAGGALAFTLRAIDSPRALTLRLRPCIGGARYEVVVPLPAGTHGPIVVAVDAGRRTASIDTRAAELRALEPPWDHELGDLHPRALDRARDWPMLRGHELLRAAIQRGAVQ